MWQVVLKSNFRYLTLFGRRIVRTVTVLLIPLYPTGLNNGKITGVIPSVVSGFTILRVIKWWRFRSQMVAAMIQNRYGGLTKFIFAATVMENLIYTAMTHPQKESARSVSLMIFLYQAWKEVKAISFFTKQVICMFIICTSIKSHV